MGPADETLQLSPGDARPAMARGVDGYYRAAQDGAGRWWLIGPDGQQVFCRAVHGLRAALPPGDGALAPDPVARLRRWGFNALGISRDTTGRDDGLPFIASVEFCAAGQVIQAPGVRLPDVFDPEWPRLAQARAAEVCTPLAGCKELIGWATDDALAWGQASAIAPGRPMLLQLCLSLEPSLAAYHAAWEFVLASHAGRMDTLARAWGTPLQNKEVVREMTRAERGIATRGYLRDEARWTRELARRYFTATSAAVRRADPNHMVLGCRFRNVVGSQVLAECSYPAVDIAMPEWRELPAAGATVTNPVFAGDVSWVDEAFFGAARDRGRRLTTFERMLRSARGSLDRLADHPSVVGYLWARWQDEPGEQPPFARGLVHVNEAEAHEHTELLTDFNFRCEALRRTVPKTVQR